MKFILSGLFLMLLIIAALLFTKADNQNSAGLAMPAFEESRKEVYEAYKLDFLPDGYPGKKTDKGLVAHPIYGPSVIRDYLNSYESGKGDVYLKASERVARAGLARMDEFKGSYAFMYREGDGISSKKEDHYSALTQAQWLYVLGLLWKYTNDQFYLNAAEKVLASLEVPVSEGGVAKPMLDGIALEEWPSQVPSYILNGWTTAILNVYWYSQLTGSEKALNLFNKNIPPLERMLPLYDVENLANTRYQLSGFVYLKVKPIQTNLEVIDASVIVPSEGKYKVSNSSTDRWLNHLKPMLDNQQLVNVVLSRASYPKNNSVELVFNNKQPGKVALEIAHGDYSPLSTSMKVTQWIPLGEFELARNDEKLMIDIPWDKAELVAYPTNFKKKYGNNHYNAYHFIHIMNLQKLAEITKSQVFTDYANKWNDYVKLWPTMSVYTDSAVNLTPYSALKVEK